MSSSSPESSAKPIIVELRSPGTAALLAWLLPGAGHFYQRRYSKGMLFSICILGTFFFGLAMSGGRVVYASFSKGDRRWQYICQVGVGLPAMPALIQNRLAKQGKSLGEWMRPPQSSGNPQIADELAKWHKQYHSLFELGTLYTMIAGLLNVLAIYDAAFGPFVPHQDEGRGPPGDDDESKDSDTKQGEAS